MAKPSKAVANGAPPGCEFCRHEVNHAALGHKLREEREAMGMSQAEVARVMKVVPTFVCDLEHGKRNWTARMVQRYLAAVRGTP
jgi:predicted transcriptional regulator